MPARVQNLFRTGLCYAGNIAKQRKGRIKKEVGESGDTLLALQPHKTLYTKVAQHMTPEMAMNQYW